jgi:hypothetical protein
VDGLYRSAGLHVLEVARRRGLAEAKAREIEALLRSAAPNRDRQGADRTTIGD